MRLGEVRQVLLGTLLLSFAFESIATMAFHGGSGLAEHCREPDDENAVSIWRLPALQMILLLPEIPLVNVAQGLFGASSSKPTLRLFLRFACRHLRGISILVC